MDVGQAMTGIASTMQGDLLAAVMAVSPYVLKVSFVLAGIVLIMRLVGKVSHM